MALGSCEEKDNNNFDKTISGDDEKAVWYFGNLARDDAEELLSSPANTQVIIFVIYFKDVFQSNSWYYMIGSNGHWAQSSCNISGASHHGVVLLLALLKVINQVSSFKNFREK